MPVTRVELEKRFTADALMDLAADADGVLDTRRVDQAMSDASSEVEGYLASRYQLPLSSVPEVVERLICDLAWYYLHGQIKPAHVKERYERAVQMLKDIARGDVGLSLTATGSAPVLNDSAEMCSAPAHWSRDRAQGFL